MSALRVQLVSSHVHELVEGAPADRRRLLDWGVFHVEHSYLKHLQRYRRALRQRTAVLRESLSASALDAWEEELVKEALLIEEARRRYLSTLVTEFRIIASDRLFFDADLDYFPGWATGEALRDRLRISRSADAERGFAQAGPHRADLRLRCKGMAIRNRSSRGQQKLLGAALVLATVAVLPPPTTGASTVLLVDEPAADLDAENLRRLSGALSATRAQLFVASLQLPTPFDNAEKHVFHVEHSEVKPLI
jgi:DNA replication and repair protein RecF